MNTPTRSHGATAVRLVLAVLSIVLVLTLTGGAVLLLSAVSWVDPLSTPQQLLVNAANEIFRDGARSLIALLKLPKV